jgi:hypothetical protein
VSETPYRHPTGNHTQNGLFIIIAQKKRQISLTIVRPRIHSRRRLRSCGKILLWHHEKVRIYHNALLSVCCTAEYPMSRATEKYLTTGLCYSSRYGTRSLSLADFDTFAGNIIYQQYVQSIVPWTPLAPYLPRWYLLGLQITPRVIQPIAFLRNGIDPYNSK